jgi:predicted transcriptional regulator
MITFKQYLAEANITNKEVADMANANDAALIKLIEMKPDNWSNFRLLYWLTRPHAEFEDTPADALRSDHAAVIAAFERAIQPVEHG